jgi:hypothetical protein
MPVFLIDARRPYDVHEERLPSSFPMFQEVDHYNTVDVPVASGGVTRMLPSDIERSGEEGDMLNRCLSWGELSFRRADAIAERYRLRFFWTSRFMYLMAAMAVLAVAISVELRETRLARGFAFLEVAFMVAVFVLWLLIRRELRNNWTTSRFLAERLRSVVMLAFAGCQNVSEPSPEGAYRGNTQEWLTRVYREVWRSRPRLDPLNRGVADVKDLLCRAWVDPQVVYYRRRSDDHTQARRFFTATNAVLFAATIVAATLHAGFEYEHSLSRTIVILSIALPAFAAAFAAIAGLEQHARHAERFGLMARRLGEMADRLRRVVDLDMVRDIALRIEVELRTEGDAWIGVVRFQEVDLPV